MPIYEYVCDACHLITEQHRKVEARKPGPPCPECDIEMHLVISGAPFIFKTTGFPGNDMKDAGGSTSGQAGRKPTHKEYEKVEAEHPEYFKSNKDLQEQVKDLDKSTNRR